MDEEDVQRQKDFKRLSKIKPTRKAEPIYPIFRERPWLPWPETAFDRAMRERAERKANEAARKSDDDEADSDA